MEKEKIWKKYYFDLVVILLIITVALSVFLVSKLTKKEGSVAVVEINGEVVAEYPLSISGVFSINGGTNVLVIENGNAYLNYSSCPDHTCERHGKIHYVGEQIICLPNRVVITVKGTGGVDLIS